MPFLSWGQASPQLGPLTGPDPWGSTLPYRVYHTPKCATYVCVCLTSLPGVAPGDRASLMLDRRSYSVTITTPMAPNFLCWCLSLGEDGKSPTY